jgi:hypothetical protein
MGENMRGQRRLILVALGLFFMVPGAGARAQAPVEATVNVPVFPSGRMSPEQLASVAAAIRRLEANPLAADGMEARRNLLTWLSDSPDVTVKVCGDVVPTTGQETVRSVFFQFVVSSAAFIIEHPDQANDELAVNLAGVQGALHTYQLLKARLGKEAKNGALEELLRKQEQGQLEAHVRAGVARCNAGTAPR